MKTSSKYFTLTFTQIHVESNIFHYRQLHSVKSRVIVGLHGDNAKRLMGHDIEFLSVEYQRILYARINWGCHYSTQDHIK